VEAMKTKRTTRLTASVAAVLAAALLVPASAGAEPATTTAPTPTAPTLRATLQQDAEGLLAQGAPGVLADLRTPRGVVKVRAGAADTGTGRPVPWNTRFRIGSLTKPFVSTAVLQLVGRGRLSLDDTVDDWLPGLVRGHGNDGRKVTVRMLLQHTSGLPEYLQGMPWLFSQEGFEAHRYDTVTPRRAVRTAMRFPREFAPGTSWSYSNTNYQLAGMVIEAVTGRPWQQAVRRGILRPLRLDQTVLPGTRPGLPSPHAIGYERFPGPDATPEDPAYGDPIDATRQNPSWGGAAGDMISTTRDTNRFLRALVRGRLLEPAEQRELMRTVPVSAAFRQNWPGARYGLGLMRIPVSCGVSWAHGGDIMGFQTRNGVLANGRRSVTVTMNTDSFVPEPGAPVVTEDKTNALIDHALCGR
jgi:D-alanyl-D-alanine carboxypeptidase